MPLNTELFLREKQILARAIEIKEKIGGGHTVFTEVFEHNNLWPFFPTLNFFNNWSSALMFLPAGFIMHEIYFKNKKIKD